MSERLPKEGNLLEVRNLMLQFSHEKRIFDAVKGINFCIGEKETLGLVGESGSGKTVTALTLLQLLTTPPVYHLEGEIYFNAKHFGWVDLLKITEQQRKQIRGNEIGFVFQEPMTALNPVFTCGGQIIETLKAHHIFNSKEARERVLYLFEKVKLGDPYRIFTSYPFELSGGQKQRVVIAQALACNPRLLIADEPTTALDVTIQADIINLLGDLKEEFNLSVLFITHDLNVIAGISDRVIVMFNGKIVEEGSIWQIFADPQHPYTKGLLACRPRMNIRLKTLPTVHDFIELNESGEIIEKKDIYRSVGEAIIINAEMQEDLIQRRLQVVRGGTILRASCLVKTFSNRSKRFFNDVSSVKAVDNVSFEIYPGETIGLVGESGCGKSTLGRILIRLLNADSGSIEFNNKDITLLAKNKLREIRKDMQIIFQDPNAVLDTRQSIGNAIMEPMRIHHLFNLESNRIEKTIQLLEMVGMHADDYYKYPHEFSGGQRQRICIARILACEPRFIICDESVSSLDVSVQAQILNLLNKLKKEFNLTYLFISHDLSVIRFISDRILVMKEGRLIEMGFPETLFDQPREDYTRKLIESIPKGDLEIIRKNQLRRKMDKTITLI
jgi:peptide/nickel transport system ATP-binding protein